MYSEYGILYGSKRCKDGFRTKVKKREKKREQKKNSPKTHITNLPWEHQDLRSCLSGTQRQISPEDCPFRKDCDAAAYPRFLRPAVILRTNAKVLVCMRRRRHKTQHKHSTTDKEKRKKKPSKTDITNNNAKAMLNDQQNQEGRKTHWVRQRKFYKKEEMNSRRQTYRMAPCEIVSHRWKQLSQKIWLYSGSTFSPSTMALFLLDITSVRRRCPLSCKRAFDIKWLNTYQEQWLGQVDSLQLIVFGRDAPRQIYSRKVPLRVLWSSSLQACFHDDQRRRALSVEWQGEHHLAPYRAVGRKTEKVQEHDKRPLRERERAREREREREREPTCWSPSP